MSEIKKITPQIEETWKNVLINEFTKPYFFKIKETIISDRKKNTIHPVGSRIFAAYNNTPFDKVKVIIINLINLIVHTILFR